MYITRPGGHDTTYRGPYTARDVKLRIYTLNARYFDLVGTIDRYVNAVAPPGTFYLPLGDRVMCCFALMGHVEGAEPKLGYMREVDVAFFVPVARFEGAVVTGVEFFAPYLFVDMPQAMATGREVHGYRKDLGASFSDVDVQADAYVPNAADLTHVDAWTIAAPFARLKVARLVDVLPPAPGGATSAWASADDVIKDFLDDLLNVGELFGRASNVPGLVALLQRGPLGGAIEQLFRKLIKGVTLEMTILFMRQFRGARNSAQADLQQLLHAQVRLPLAELSGHRLPSGYKLEFHDTASHPMTQELGLSSGQLASSLSVESSCEFRLEHAS